MVREWPAERPKRGAKTLRPLSLEQRHQNSALARSYKSAPIGLAFLDTDLRFVHINDWLAAINGLTVEAHLGRRLSTILPDVAQGVDEQLRSVIETGEPILCGKVHAETPLHPGSKHHYEHNYYPEKSDDGTVIGIRCVVQDVTERTLAQERIRDLEAENTYLQKEIQDEFDFEGMIGSSARFLEVLRRIEQVAGTDSSVLVLGETGTGKELVVRAIHNGSQRSRRPLVKVNCAAIPEGLMESEFFGHERGAFTGALTRKKGRFELADGGTIFLDEVGDLPLEIQAKLLRVLQEGEFERLGSTQTISVDVRVLAASNRDLKSENGSGFRSDLYYRLNVFPIEVPPLRERVLDIPLLVWYFIAAKQGGFKKTIEKVPVRVMEAMQGYAWPGNVRELENVIERALIISPDRTLIVDEIFNSSASEASSEAPEKLEEIQRAHIVRVLDKCDWAVKGQGNAAERLGLNASTLRSRMKMLCIERPPAKGSSL